MNISLHFIACLLYVFVNHNLDSLQKNQANKGQIIWWDINDD